MKKLISSILIAVFILGIKGTCYAEQTTDNNSYLRVYSLDVGEGAATVVDCDGYIMIIDGGKPECSDMIYSFLKEHEYKRVDYLVASHADTDHIGGLSGALNYAKAGMIFCTVKENDSKAFKSFVKSAEQQNNRIIVPNAGDVFSLGSASVEILLPERGVKYSDNTSLILRLTYGDISFIFMGDAEKPDEEVLIKSGCELESTILFVGHHGSSSSTGTELLDAVKPKYAVLSVGANQYGHPTEEVLSCFAERNVSVYRTDENGTIIIDCNSQGEINVLPEKEAKEKSAPLLLLVPEETSEAVSAITKITEPAVEEKVTMSYVANKNTKKFHYPSCKSVSKIKEANRWYYDGTRDELISMGYDPCGNCNP